MNEQEKMQEIERLTGKIELIDYLIDWHCKCELKQETRAHLENLRYGFKVKIDELNESI